MTTRVLIAGIGNIFLGDDGFGPEVLRRLPKELPPGVRAHDYGIGCLHLAYDLCEPWDVLVLVDALPDRGAPGQIDVLSVDPTGDGRANLDVHALDPQSLFASARALGATLPATIVVVGCQVESVADGIGLTDRVSAALDKAVASIWRLVGDHSYSEQVV